MNSRIKEALGILQEECAEVIVEISKSNRFGLETKHYKTQQLHKEMLENEIGDVLALIDILKEEKIITDRGLADAIQRKKHKLKLWSNLYENKSS